MEKPKVLIACLHCDRKAHNQLIPHDSIINQTYENKAVYYNIQTLPGSTVFAPLLDKILDPEYPNFHTDLWTFSSTWWKKPTFDQDQSRLVPICIGRNMSIDAAIGLDCEYLMFIDSDMTCAPDTLERFIETAQRYNRPIVFGEVKGRNDHKSAEYFFPGKYGPSAKHLGDDVHELHHGNIGFALIHKSVFLKLRFRSGPYILDHTYTDLQSDDPNFVTDAVHALGLPWPVLDRKIKASHKDEEHIPFGGGAQY